MERRRKIPTNINLFIFIKAYYLKPFDGEKSGECREDLGILGGVAP